MRTIRLLISMAGLMVLVMTTNVLAQDWPQWRGADRDGKVSGFNAPKSWPVGVTQK